MQDARAFVLSLALEGDDSRFPFHASKIDFQIPCFDDVDLSQSLISALFFKSPISARVKLFVSAKTTAISGRNVDANSGAKFPANLAFLSGKSLMGNSAIFFCQIHWQFH